MRSSSAIVIIPILVLLISCATVDPQRVDVELTKTKPDSKITAYSNPLIDLGLMTEIYDIPQFKIQSTPINDKTGASGPTGGEIPRDITEMIKSALNSIGGKVTYIPYDPAFIQNQANTNYSAFESIIRPDVILSGGITEFDRGLEVRGGTTDVSGERNLSFIPDNEVFQSGKIAARYGSSAKAGLARITLDFNLLDFKTMTGVSRMNATNSMEIGKALKERELAVSIFGISFGRKGTIRKVQGRHEAVRLLVELSMIQIVGKYNAIPYWRLLGDEALEDMEVIRAMSRFYNSLSETEIVTFVQEWLFLHGHDVPINGVLDSATLFALQQFKGNSAPGGKIDLATFRKIYLTIPINESVLNRRDRVNALYAQQQASLVNENEQTAQVYQEEGQTQMNTASNTAQQTYDSESREEVEEVVEESPPANVEVKQKKELSIGKFLTEDAW